MPTKPNQRPAARLPCSTCKGSRFDFEEVCSACRHAREKLSAAKREARGLYTERRYPARQGVELDALEPTPDEEKALREARVAAYIATMREGVIDYQKAIREAAGIKEGLYADF